MFTSCVLCAVFCVLFSVILHPSSSLVQLFRDRLAFLLSSLFCSLSLSLSLPPSLFLLLPTLSSRYSIIVIQENDLGLFIPQGHTTPMSSRNPTTWDQYERGGRSPGRNGSFSSVGNRSVQFEDESLLGRSVDANGYGEDGEWPQLRRRRQVD